MGINLALSRITKLLSVLGDPHLCYKSLHIAGTNGKGSTIAYITSVLSTAGITNGRFTSPHLMYYNDSICINNETYPLVKFNKVSELVKREDKVHEIGCTEFELLTATAYKIFQVEKVDYAVIEVGLGGKMDATNVLSPYRSGVNPGGVVACGITKIGMDHESFLGTNEGEIAAQKAGIIKPNVPCVVDSTNSEVVLEVVQKESQRNNSPLYLVDGIHDSESVGVEKLTPAQLQHLNTISPLQGNYQLQNLSVALKLIEILWNQGAKLTLSSITQGIKTTSWSGRLQQINVPGQQWSLLIDGAHNESAAIELAKYLDGYRPPEGIIFIIGMTSGKNMDLLLRHIAGKSDAIIASTFSAPEGMPWIKSYDVEAIQAQAQAYFNEIIPSSNEDSIGQILKKVSQIKTTDPRKVVVCGSLYLCSDVLREIDHYI